MQSTKVIQKDAFFEIKLQYLYLLISTFIKRSGFIKEEPTLSNDIKLTAKYCVRVGALSL